MKTQAIRTALQAEVIDRAAQYGLRWSKKAKTNDVRDLVDMGERILQRSGCKATLEALKERKVKRVWKFGGKILSQSTSISLLEVRAESLLKALPKCPAPVGFTGTTDDADEESEEDVTV